MLYCKKKKKYELSTIPLDEDMVHSCRLMHVVLATVE